MKGDVTLASTTLEHAERRSERLWMDIRDLLAPAGVALDQIDGFAVCVGPGAFTGLRVGIAATKGLAVAAGRPAAGVTSMEAAAVTGPPLSIVCALVNSYKSEVYSQLFSLNEQGVPVALNEPLVSTSAVAIERVAERRVFFAGNGIDACAELIQNLDDRQWSVVQTTGTVAEAVARVASLKPEVWELPLRACYVRPAEAEVKLSLGLLGSKIRRTLEER